MPVTASVPTARLPGARLPRPGQEAADGPVAAGVGGPLAGAADLDGEGGTGLPGHITGGGHRGEPAKSQVALVDGGSAVVGVGSGEDQQSRTGFSESGGCADGVADCTADGGCHAKVGAIRGNRAVGTVEVNFGRKSNAGFGLGGGCLKDERGGIEEQSAPEGLKSGGVAEDDAHAGGPIDANAAGPAGDLDLARTGAKGADEVFSPITFNDTSVEDEVAWSDVVV